MQEVAKLYEAIESIAHLKKMLNVANNKCINQLWIVAGDYSIKERLKMCRLVGR